MKNQFASILARKNLEIIVENQDIWISMDFLDWHSSLEKDPWDELDLPEIKDLDLPYTLLEHASRRNSLVSTAHDRADVIVNLKRLLQALEQYSHIG